MADRLDAWLARGKTIIIGGKDVYVMPLPISKLKGIAEYLQDHVEESLLGLFEEQKQSPNLMGFVLGVLQSMEISTIVLKALTCVKDPVEKKAVNDWLTAEFLDDNLDIPVIQELLAKFSEVNELEQLLKNVQSRPVLKKIMDGLSKTFGILLLNSLPTSTGLVPETLEDSLSPNSSDTSEPGTEGTLPQKKEGETIQ